VPADRIAYPDADMIRKLLDLREHSVGATTIVSDKPKNNYYVAALLQREEPAPDEFRRVYSGSMVGAIESDQLLAYLAQGHPEQYRQAVVEQLRKEAGVVTREAAKRTGE